ncbi:hypothetical protein Tco_0383597 [Tanacetum coccineum]
MDAGTQEHYVAGSSEKDKEPTQEYILLPLHPHRPRISIEDVVQAAQDKPSENFPKDNDVHDSEDVAEKEEQHMLTEADQTLKDDLERMIAQEIAAKTMDDATRQAFEEEKKRAAQATSINKLNTGRPSVSTSNSPLVSTANTPYASADRTPTSANTGGSSFVYLVGQIPIDASTLPNADLPIDPNMPNLEDDSNVFPNDGIFSGAYDNEDVGAVVDFNYMDNTIDVSPIPTLRVHKDHPKGQILGDPKSAVQTRGKIQKDSLVQQALVLEDFTTYCCWFNIGAASEDLVLLRKIEENRLMFNQCFIIVALDLSKVTNPLQAKGSRSIQKMTEQDSPPPTITAMKIPIIKKGEYDIWSMRMRQYICHTDHNLWDIIVDGDLQEEAAPAGEQSGPPAPKTAKQLTAKRNQERVKSILLLAIPDEYLLKFHNVPDAKSLWAAIKSRFGGNDESKKMQRNVLKHQFENFTTAPNESLDKAYDRFQKLISQLEVHAAPVSKEDINQKFLRRYFEDEDEKGLQVPHLLLSTCHFLFLWKTSSTNAVRSERNQGRRSYGDNSRSNAPTNESSSQALVAQDGLGGYDWSNDFEVELVNYALMAISSSSSSSSSDNEIQKCSKQCLESFKTLQKEFISSDEENTPANDRFSKEDKFHAVPPPKTGNFLTPRTEISFAESRTKARKLMVNSGPSVGKTSINMDNTKRVNHQKFSKYPHLRKIFVPSGVLTTNRVQNMTTAGTRAVVNTGKVILIHAPKKVELAANPERDLLQDHAVFKLLDGNVKFCYLELPRMDVGLSLDLKNIVYLQKSFVNMDNTLVVPASDSVENLMTVDGSSTTRSYVAGYNKTTFVMLFSKPELIPLLALTNSTARRYPSVDLVFELSARCNAVCINIGRPFLEKTDGNDEFHEIIDFLTRRSLSLCSHCSYIILAHTLLASLVQSQKHQLEVSFVYDDVVIDLVLPNQAIFDTIQLMGCHFLKIDPKDKGTKKVLEEKKLNPDAEFRKALIGNSLNLKKKRVEAEIAFLSSQKRLKKRRREEKEFTIEERAKYCFMITIAAQKEAMIDEGVTAVLAARATTRNGDDSHTSGNRGSGRLDTVV